MTVVYFNLFSEKPIDHVLKNMPALIGRIENVRRLWFQWIETFNSQFYLIPGSCFPPLKQAHQGITNTHRSSLQQNNVLFYQSAQFIPFEHNCQRIIAYTLQECLNIIIFLTHVTGTYMNHSHCKDQVEYQTTDSPTTQPLTLWFALTQ